MFFSMDSDECPLKRTKQWQKNSFVVDASVLEGLLYMVKIWLEGVMSVRSHIEDGWSNCLIMHKRLIW